MVKYIGILDGIDAVAVGRRKPDLVNTNPVRCSGPAAVRRSAAIFEVSHGHIFSGRFGSAFISELSFKALAVSVVGVPL
jgi:hypothetical protein